MKSERTPWMTAIGVLDIVLGSIAALLAVALFLGGVGVSDSVNTIRANLGETPTREFVTNEAIQHADMAEQELEAVQAFILPDAGVSIFLGITLVLSGIGVLKLARWARPASMAWALLCIAWLLLMEILNPVDFDPLALLLFLYPIVILYLFSTREWRDVFRWSAETAG